MRITLISLDQELYTVGIRILAACLRRSGYEVRCIFMPVEFSGRIKKGKFSKPISQELIEELGQLCIGSELIGISLLTNHFLQASQITDYLHRSVKAPIIWGGIGPTVEPDVCIHHADIICVGEGEEALLELVKCIDEGRSYNGIEGLWIRNGEDVIQNPLRPLRQNLDELPVPDYSCQNHFVVSQNRIVPLTTSLLTRFQGERYKPGATGINYPILSSRGCPYNCSYCCNSVFERLYHGQRRLRWRGAENIVAELKQIQSQLGRINTVFFVDDNFTARSIGDLRTFCKLYKEELNIPFFCQVSPLTINAEKMDMLLKAGCIKISMGVETASDRIAALYNRSISHAATPKAIELIESNRHRMPFPPTYQFIIDNPYETLSETIETLTLALSLSKPWNNPIYSLILFPGTPIFEKALEDGLITDKSSQVYGKNWLDHSRPYLQLWIRMYRKNFPRFFLRWLLHPVIVGLFCRDIPNKPGSNPGLD